MIRRSLAVALVLIACSLSRPAAHGCTLAVKPTTSFDASEYVFTGTVTGHTRPTGFSGDDANAWGVIVAVDEVVHLPRAAQRFAVFPYELSSDCSTFGWDEEETREAYPEGTRVRIIAREAKLAKGAPRRSNNDTEVIRLVIEPYEGSIAPNLPVGGYGYMATATSTYDYKSWRCPSPDEGASADSAFSIDEFELRKDLLRLRNAASPNEKRDILERLVYLANDSEAFAEIARKHVKDSQARRDLERRHEAWLTEFRRDYICR